MLCVKNVSKTFKENCVLDAVSFQCESGKICGIVGYNGSGKTVLMKCILGLLKYDSGTIEYDGRIIGKDVDMLPNCGAIIEEPGFLNDKSAYYNLKFLYELRQHPNKEHIYKTLEQVGLPPEMKKHVGKFSLGMKQRLAIAQAIMEDPSILLLDEPMNGLDKNGVSQMRDLFIGLRDMNKTILLASHNQNDIDILCDYVFEIENGQLTQLR